MKGFTLIELIIYIAILATILVVITGFLWLIVLDNIKGISYQEVQQNGRFALDKINREIKKATGINNPPSGNSDVSLDLAMADPDLDPTIFEVESGKLKITQGNNQSYYLTTDQTTITNLQFTNLSYNNTPGIVKVEMEINHVNPGSRIEYQAAINLKSSFSLLPNKTVPHCAGHCTICSAIENKQDCNNQNGCSWRGKLKICFDDPGCTSCNSYTTEPECITQNGCWWEAE